MPLFSRGQLVFLRNRRWSPFVSADDKTSCRRFTARLCMGGVFDRTLPICLSLMTERFLRDPFHRFSTC
jgi:hypothetical protein